MARPRIFISSTFYDLKYIRTSLERFIDALGYEAVLSEKGSIAYNPDIPLDESCYREASACDVFVLVIGGRYGSAASDHEVSTVPAFYERYESITRREYEAAVQRDVPTYILIERSVHAEYQTFRRNRDNEDIKYAHVDSVNIFHLIDQILTQPRNNPVYQFDRHTEIEVWLREQWAGLFKEMISTRSGHKQLASLAAQVGELAIINTTLKRYLEEVVSRVSDKGTAERIIESEEQRLAEARRVEEFKQTRPVAELIDSYKMPLDEVLQIFTAATSLEDLAHKVENKISDGKRAKSITEFWRNEKSGVVDEINEARRVLGLSELRFQTPAEQKRSNKSLKRTR